MRHLRFASIVFAGSVVPLFGIRLLATTVAWSVPRGYFEVFKAADSLPLGLLLVDTFATFGVAYGLPALLVLGALLAAGLVRTVPHVAAYVLAGIFGFRVLAPASLGAPIVWPSAPEQLGGEVALVLVGAVGVVMLRLWPNNSSKPTPLRGAA